MGDRVIADIVTIATAVIGLTIVAVLVSKQAQTGTLITDSGTAFGSVLKAAVSPLGS
jgi:PRD1 phage membrane DNA delivery